MRLMAVPAAVLTIPFPSSSATMLAKEFMPTPTQAVIWSNRLQPAMKTDEAISELSASPVEAFWIKFLRFTFILRVQSLDLRKGCDLSGNRIPHPKGGPTCRAGLYLSKMPYVNALVRPE